MDKCFICGNKMDFFVEVKKHKINSCCNCGLGETRDFRIQKGEYHRDETYIEEEKLFRNIFLKRVNIISKLKKPGKILEIGCSTGIMLSLLQREKWQVKGVELSVKAAEIANKRGIQVLTQDFMKVKISEKFDVVILNHTLEHLENPAEVIKKINNLLSPGGLLYIDVPNFGGLSSKLMGKNWPMLLPNEHLWHFTEESLRILLQNLGFKIIFIERASGIWDYGNPFSGIWLSLINLKKRFFGEIITALPSWIVTKLGIGSDLMIIAKKM